MSDDDKVGYGNPPKRTQFQPGRSGNPKGQPKGSKKAGTVLKEALNKKITIKVGDKTRKVTKWEAFVETLINDSIKGDNKARTLLLAMARQTGELEIPPENKVRPGGVLRLGPIRTPEEWEKDLAEHQRKYREAPYVGVKKPDPNDPKKLN